MENNIRIIDFNRTDFSSEEEVKAYLSSLVLSYATQMNELEAEIYQKSDADRSKDFFPEFKECYLPIFNAYCSEKQRSYGGKASSYGIPTNFDGIEKFVENSVELKNKNRAEVYFKTENSFDAEYLFVVLRKNDVWRIDNAKYRWYGKEKWSLLIL